MGKSWRIIRRREHYGGSCPATFPFFRLGGLARSQISARIGARQSNRRGNLSRGVFPYAVELLLNFGIFSLEDLAVELLLNFGMFSQSHPRS